MRRFVEGTGTAGRARCFLNAWNPNTSSETMDVQAGARALGVTLIVANASSESEIDAAFSTFVGCANAILLGGDPLFFSRRVQLAVLAAKHSIPTAHDSRLNAEAGGLMSYGADIFGIFYRQVGTYTGRILKGEKPSDLPVQQSVKLQLVLNLKTAKTIRTRECVSKAPRPRRRGDRIGWLFAAAHSRFWHFSAVPTAPSDVRFQGVKQPCCRNPETAEVAPSLPFDNQFCCDAQRTFLQRCGRL